MPEELRNKFQFYTHADNQLSFISEIAKSNELKMIEYIKTDKRE